MAIDPDLEQARERFLNSLHNPELAMAREGGFEQYWREVAQEAAITEDHGKLDRWVRDLARDRDKVKALKDKKAAAEQGDQAAMALVQLILRVLAILDEIYEKLYKRRAALRGTLLNWLVLAGPGMKSKPNPNLQDGADAKDTKAKEAALAKKKATPKPTKTKAP